MATKTTISTLTAPKFHRTLSLTAAHAPPPEPAFTRDTVRIPSLTQGWDLDAWRFLPRGAKASGKPRPVVILAHGLSGNKTMGLAPYCEAFAAAGYAAVAFDYRRWGASDGAPRCAVVVRDQLDDYRTVVRWCRQQPEFDPSRVIVWGTSFAGGHAIALAADAQLAVAGAISQCPFTGVFPRATLGLVLGILVALADIVLRVFRPSRPLYIPATAAPGCAGAMTVAGSVAGMAQLGGEWDNKISAASLFQVPRYDPGRTAQKIGCPTLVVACVQDQIFTWKRGKNVATRAKEGVVAVAEVDGDHWAPYPGQHGHAKSLGAQLAYLQKHFPL